MKWILSLIEAILIEIDLRSRAEVFLEEKHVKTETMKQRKTIKNDSNAQFRCLFRCVTTTTITTWQR